MKKLALVLGVFTVLAFTSCSKEKTCLCTTTVSGTTSGTSELVTKEDCNSLDTETTVMGITSKMTCKEK